MAKNKDKTLYLVGGLLLAGVAFFGVRALTRRRQPDLPPVDGVLEIGPITTTPPGSQAQPGDACTTGGQIDPRPAGVPPAGNMNDPDQLQQVFGWISQLYGPAIARNVEKIYRLETAHFASGQYKATGSPGMTATKLSFPYGWNSLAKLWRDRPESAPIGIVRWCVRGKVYAYLAFGGSYGFLALAEILKKRGNNAGSWYSTIPAQQQAYVSKLSGITPRYT